MENDEHRVLFTQEAAKLLSQLESPVERDVYAKKIAMETRISDSAVSDEITKVKEKTDKEFMDKAAIKRIRQYSETSVSDSMQNSKGIQQAQRNLIYLAMNHADVYEKIKNIVKPQDYIDDVYIRLAKFVYEACDKGKNIHPADTVNIFELPDEQKKAAEAFALRLDFESVRDMEKAVNEIVKLIKRTKIDAQVAKADSVEMLTELINEKKKMDNLYIKL